MSQRKSKKKNGATEPIKMSANITEEMRKSLKEQEFENSDRTPVTSAEKTTGSTEKIEYILDGKRPTEPIVIKSDTYIGDQDACPDGYYLKTDATDSMNTVVSFHDDQQQAKNDIEILPPPQFLKFDDRAITYPARPVIRQPIHLTHQEFIDGTTHIQQAFTFAKVGERLVPNEAENRFIDTILRDVSKMVGENGRTDVQLDFSITKEANGLPRLHVSLCRRVPEKPLICEYKTKKILQMYAAERQYAQTQEERRKQQK